MSCMSRYISTAFPGCPCMVARHSHSRHSLAASSPPQPVASHSLAPTNHNSFGAGHDCSIHSLHGECYRRSTRYLACRAHADAPQPIRPRRLGRTMSAPWTSFEWVGPGLRSGFPGRGEGCHAVRRFPLTPMQVSEPTTPCQSSRHGAVLGCITVGARRLNASPRTSTPPSAVRTRANTRYPAAL